MPCQMQVYVVEFSLGFKDHSCQKNEEFALDAEAWRASGDNYI